MKPSIKVCPVQNHVDSGYIAAKQRAYRALSALSIGNAATDAVSAHPHGAAQDQRSRKYKSRNRANQRHYSVNGALCGKKSARGKSAAGSRGKAPLGIQFALLYRGTCSEAAGNAAAAARKVIEQVRSMADGRGQAVFACFA